MSCVSPKNERTSSLVMVGVNSLICSDVTCVGVSIGSLLSGNRLSISSVNGLLSPASIVFAASFISFRE